MSDVVTIIEYRLIRPDGTLLWTAMAPNYMSMTPPPISPRLAHEPENYVLPPWRYEYRESGGDWMPLEERLT